MDKSIYLAMNGASQAMRSLAFNSNNLANANTVGFMKDYSHLVSLPVTGEGLPTREFSMAKENGIDYSKGSVITTGRSLDIYIENDGMLAVQLPDNNEGYTRNGNLKLSTNGLLLTSDDRPVLGNNGGPVSIPPADKIEIGNDGTISIIPSGNTASTLIVVDRLKLVSPDDRLLVKSEYGALTLPAGEILAPDSRVRIASGSLEGSNSNAVEVMVEMIGISRLFESQIKMMKAVKENDEASTKLLKLT